MSGGGLVINTSGKRTGGALRVFLWALLLSFAFYVPIIIYGKGYFLFMGDFNVQQIPFYRLAQEAVRSGNIFWNWHTDLGANFIGSYSFYLLFSPFFWLTLPFPNDFLPFLMGPLIILKTSCAALTSFLYIKRFVKDVNWAILGAMLYAFSGFMTFNIFFNHFHDVAVFFPLLLVSLEELVTNNRRIFFALMVALNCMINYWFFIGEVVFVILYVFMRMITGGWGCTFGKFLLIVIESLLGVSLAPSPLCQRFGSHGKPENRNRRAYLGLAHVDIRFQSAASAIIQSFFFPPEMPSRPNFFPDMAQNGRPFPRGFPSFPLRASLRFAREG
jgi:uncharacterized membrane protein YfhO